MTRRIAICRRHEYCMCSHDGVYVLYKHDIQDIDVRVVVELKLKRSLKHTMTVGLRDPDTSQFFFFTFFHHIASHTERRCPSTFCAHHQSSCHPTQYQLVCLHVTFVRGVAPLVLSPAEHTAAIMSHCVLHDGACLCLSVPSC